MTIPTLHKTAGEGIHYSVVELNGFCQVHATAVPRVGATLRDQARDALEAVAQVMNDQGAAGAVVHQAVFLADGALVPACRQFVHAFYGANLPATSYISQPPCGGELLAVEALALRSDRQPTAIQRISDQLVVARNDGVAWVYVDHAVPRTSAPGVYEKTICTYQHLRRLLPEAGARLDQVLRTWLYLGGIVAEEGNTQRYKELNRARAVVYQRIPFLAEHLPVGYDGPAFPASTGIGTNGRSISISALALVSDKADVLAVPLENPRQTAAYQYATTYSPSSPKFSRGLALCCGDDATLFISGTASITRSETRHAGDVAAQTHELLDNITALIAEDNLSRHGLPGRGATLDGLGVARVYIKRRDDHARVREVCRQRLGEVPATYVVADVCRPELLVEIEGIAFSRRTPTASDALPRRRCGAGAPAATARSDEYAPLCPENCPERFVCPHAVLE